MALKLLARNQHPPPPPFPSALQQRKLNKAALKIAVRSEPGSGTRDTEAAYWSITGFAE